MEYDAEFRRRPPLPPLDRAAIKSHIDPKLRGKPLQELFREILPPIPGL